MASGRHVTIGVFLNNRGKIDRDAATASRRRHRDGPKARFVFPGLKTMGFCVPGQTGARTSSRRPSEPHGTAPRPVNRVNGSRRRVPSDDDAILILKRGSNHVTGVSSPFIPLFSVVHKNKKGGGGQQFLC